MAGEKSSQLNLFFSMSAKSVYIYIKSSKSTYHSKAIWPSRKTHIVRDISYIRDMSLHEKAASILKLSLEKSCIGTGRVINWLQATFYSVKTLACRLLETFSENYPHLPDASSEQNPAYSTFPFDPYLQPGISNNISPLK